MVNKYSLGGGQNTNNKIKQNPLFKDINDYNKYLLSLVGILFLVVTGVISYNLTNASYAKWSSSVESKNIIKLSVKSGMDATTFAAKTVGTNGLEQITHTIDNTLQVDNKFATEYRYRGGDSVVKNYVTFNNEIWRIIGIIPTEDTSGNVENRFKIVKDESIGDYNWDSDTVITYNYESDDSIKLLGGYLAFIDPDTCRNCGNNWARPSALNTYLNETYYNTLSVEAKNMIGTTKYYLGGYNTAKITSDTMWQYERKNEANRSGYYYGSNPVMQNDANKKIAIMYASDYGYGASKNCTSNLYDYDGTNCKTTNNWLDKSTYTWLFPPSSGNSNYAFNVNSTSYVAHSYFVNDHEYAVRPVLTLSSNIQISGGKGTSDKPYQLDFSNKVPIITKVVSIDGTASFYVIPSRYEITGYIATDTDEKPALNDSKWTNRVDTCNFTSGTKYFWVKDSAGNISDSYKGELSKAPCGVPEIS